jgi:hypothetical protein
LFYFEKKLRGGLVTSRTEERVRAEVRKQWDNMDDPQVGVAVSGTHLLLLVTDKGKKREREREDGEGGWNGKPSKW